MFFELYCKFYAYVFFEMDIDSYLKSHLAKKLGKKLRGFIIISQQNLLYKQKLQKQAYNKDVSLQSYILSKKV